MMMNPSDNPEMTALHIQLNGQRHSLATPCNLLQLVNEMPVELKNIAVELNQRIIPRSQLSEITLNEGDCVEIVEFIGGG